MKHCSSLKLDSCNSTGGFVILWLFSTTITVSTIGFWVFVWLDWVGITTTTIFSTIRVFNILRSRLRIIPGKNMLMIGWCNDEFCFWTNQTVVFWNTDCNYISVFVDWIIDNVRFNVTLSVFVSINGFNQICINILIYQKCMMVMFLLESI